MNDKMSFRDRLLTAEKASEELKSRYDAKVKGLLERPLKRYERIAWALSGAGACAMAIFFICVMISLPSGFPLLARLTFLVGIGFSVGWALFSVLILRRGTFRTRWDSNTATVLLWIFLVISTTAFTMMGSSAPDAAKGNQIILTGLVFLVMFGHQMPLNRINQAELNLREEILRLQLQIAELARRIPEAPPGDPAIGKD